MKSSKRTRTILIVANDNDLSGKIVSDWAYYYCKKTNKEFRKIDSVRDRVNMSSISISENGIERFVEINDESERIKIDNIEGLFFRRGSLLYKNFTYLRGNAGSLYDTKSRLSNYFMAYEANVKGFLLNSLDEFNKIGNDNGSFINKVWVLKVAQEVDISLPSTLLTTSKKELLSFYETQKPIITKSLALNLGFSNKNEQLNYTQYTEGVELNDIEQFPERFPLTMFQRRVEKLFELRVFYLRGKFKTCAMFTQNKKQTSTDYRHYDHNDPTRITPFNLPEEQRAKLRLLMVKLKLEAGSIDIIFSKQKEYIFLEVNPGGQFGYNSNNCNFMIERDIAKELV